MIRKQIVLAFLAAALLSLAHGQNLLKIDTAGMRLRQFYVSMRVDSLWKAGHHVNWETGAPDQPNATKDITTHCSAFAAAVCKRRGIYILRPPAHDTELLASAQYKWLFTQAAADSGWRQIKTDVMETAQRKADSGLVVVAVCKNPDPKRSGHIALVMPAEISPDSLQRAGPTLMQAGRTNNNFICLRTGFGKHLKSWPPVAADISFFYYASRKQKETSIYKP